MTTFIPPSTAAAALAAKQLAPKNRSKRNLVLLAGILLSALALNSLCTPDDLLGFATDTAAPFHAAMDALAREGRGVLVYLRRDAIAQVQQSPSDREVGLGAQLLGHLGIRRMRLLSRQEKKYIGLHGFGLEITATVPLDAL